MEREKWLKSEFPLNSMPIWTCPSCNSGILILEEKLIEKPTAEYQSLPTSYFDEERMEEGPMDPDMFATLKLRFTGYLKCSLPKCKEYVLISGTISNGFDSYTDPIYGESEYEVDLYKPTFFSPPLQIITIANEYPETIKEELINSFNLFWINNSACANKIRSVIELLLDDKKIARKRRNAKGKYRYLSLHERLSLFKTKDTLTANFLLSIKWIGNSGSHIEKITKKSVLDAYELLEHSLNRIYIKDHIRLFKLSNTINKKKKSI